MGLIGNIDLNAEVKGIYSKSKSLSAKLDGMVSKFSVNSYAYQNIKINGSISNKKLTTKFEVSDPNLNMEFEGLFNLTSDLRLYYFKANVIDANLYCIIFQNQIPIIMHPSLLKQIFREINR